MLDTRLTLFKNLLILTKLVHFNMTDKEAKELGFTHKGRMYGINGYICTNDDEHDTFRAEYWITDKIVEALIYLEQFILFHPDGYTILIKEKL